MQNSEDNEKEREAERGREGVVWDRGDGEFILPNEPVAQEEEEKEGAGAREEEESQGLCARQVERGREREGDNTSGANEVYVRAAAHVAQDYWDRYDKAQGWTSSIAPSSNTKSGFEGGKGFTGANRPLDASHPLPVLERVYSTAPAYALTLRETLVVGPSAAPHICPEATQWGRQRRSGCCVCV